MTVQDLAGWVASNERRVGLYTISDRVAEESGPIFSAKNVGVAKRQFQRLVEREGVDPDDFYLVQVGGFDSKSLELVALEVPEVIVVGGQQK